jgi:hypothetical protein
MITRGSLMAESSAPNRYMIVVDEDVYDLLARTAETRNTDFNGVVKYLLEAPAVTTVSSQDDDEE